MLINKINWEEKRDIASLVALGAINRAPTRLRAPVRAYAPQARRGPIYRAQCDEPQ